MTPQLAKLILLSCAMLVFVTSNIRIAAAVLSYRKQRTQPLDDALISNPAFRNVTKLVIRELLTNVFGAVVVGATAYLALASPSSFSIVQTLESGFLLGTLLGFIIAYTVHIIASYIQERML